ncbi:MAG: hypothetical protein NDI73_08680, partial [Desulfuromonadales bacterium]|nr:hypothetical protein [Desulfuromonadales bacterium]
VERLRDEQNFPSAAALQAVIRDDIARARAVLAATRVLVYKETFDCGVASPSPGLRPPSPGGRGDSP